MLQDSENPVIPQEVGMLHWIGHNRPFLVGSLPSFKSENLDFQCLLGSQPLTLLGPNAHVVRHHEVRPQEWSSKLAEKWDDSESKKLP